MCFAISRGMVPNAARRARSRNSQAPVFQTAVFQTAVKSARLRNNSRRPISRGIRDPGLQSVTVAGASDSKMIVRPGL
jgi:hypothetical protein